MSTRLTSLFTHLLASDGTPASGGLLFFYATGTTTKTATYPTQADALALTNANPNPVVLDSRGEPSNAGTPYDIFGKPGVAYDVVYAPSTDTDPPTAAIRTSVGITSSMTFYTTSAKSGNYTVLITDRNKVFLVDASSGNVTLSLPTLASAGTGFNILVIKIDSSSNSVIVDGDSSETVNGGTSVSIATQYAGVSVIAGSSSWYTLFRTAASIDILDANNNEMLTFGTTSSAVNNYKISNAATGSGPVQEAIGDDTNIDATLKAKGTGKVILGQATASGIQNKGDAPLTDSNNNELFKFVATGSAVNELTITNAATGSGPRIDATGGDTNIGIVLAAKGAGSVNVTGANLTVGYGSSGPGELRLLEDSDNGSKYTGFKAPADVTTEVIYELPAADGTSGYTLTTNGSGVLSWSALTSAATAAQQETGTATTVYTSPGTQHRHPSAAKAWVNFTMAGSTTILNSYNVSSLTDNGTGDTTVNFTTSFSSGSYAVAGISTDLGSFRVMSLYSTATTAANVRCRVVNNGGSAEDNGNNSIICFGDQ